MLGSGSIRRVGCSDGIWVLEELDEGYFRGGLE